MAINLKDKISQYFTWGEFLATNTGKPNVPNAAQQANLIQLAKNLDILRSKVGRIGITSGFRSAEVNKALIAGVGGATAAEQTSATSFHEEGKAADITPMDTAATIVFTMVAGDPELRKLFGEFAIKKTTIHLSLPKPYSTKDWTPMWVNDANQYIKFQAAELAKYIKDHQVVAAAAGIGSGIILLALGALGVYWFVIRKK